MSRLVTNLFGKALRETGQAMDRLALMINDTEFYKETYTRHRPVMDLYGKVWYNAVLRGDTDKVTVGEYTNIQDRAIIVTNVERTSPFPRRVSIGDHVTIGHGAMLTSCSIGNHVLIGQGAIVQEGVVIGNKSMVAAAAVLLPGTQVPGGQLWGGNPAVFMRNLSDADIASLDKSAKSYSVLAAEHAKDVPLYL